MPWAMAAVSFDRLREEVLSAGREIRVAVAQPEGEAVYEALAAVAPMGIRAVLVGPTGPIERSCEAHNLTPAAVIEAGGEVDTARRSVDAVSSGRADVLMKGAIRTAVIMKAVLNDHGGLRDHRLLSHVGIFEQPDGRLLGVTDGGLNIGPSLEQKIEILTNAVDAFRLYGIRRPKVALLSGIEVLNPAIPSTVDAAEIAGMAVRGEFPGVVVGGPMAFDLAFSPESCKKKGYWGKIQGDADIMIVPEIVSGNILGKTLNLAAGYPTGGIVVGANRPIVLLSRSDTAAEKTNSLTLAAYYILHGGG